MCVSCLEPLANANRSICLKCKSKLPATKFSVQEINPVMKLLWGKAEFSHASACFYFRKKGRMQRLIHALKYYGNTEVGVELGELMATEIEVSKMYQDVDIVLPVPLHPSKKRLRGYNQCDFLVEGISKKLDAKWAPNAVIRTSATDSQTRKSHFDRHQNVNRIFEVNEKEELLGKKILLVDDVITTGSTLASCANEIYRTTGSKPLICAAAIAS